MIQYTTKLQREIDALKVKLTIANHAYNELSLSQSAMALELAQTKEDFWKIHKERTDAEREVKQLKADKARLKYELMKELETRMLGSDPYSFQRSAEIKQLLNEMKEQK